MGVTRTPCTYNAGGAGFPTIALPMRPDVADTRPVADLRVRICDIAQQWICWQVRVSLSGEVHSRLHVIALPTVARSGLQPSSPPQPSPLLDARWQARCGPRLSYLPLALAHDVMAPGPARTQKLT